MARSLTHPEVRIGRPVPAVALTGGSLATSSLLLEADVDAVAVPVAPPAPDDTDLQPGRGTAYRSHFTCSRSPRSCSSR